MGKAQVHKYTYVEFCTTGTVARKEDITILNTKCSTEICLMELTSIWNGSTLKAVGLIQWLQLYDQNIRATEEEVDTVSSVMLITNSDQ